MEREGVREWKGIGRGLVGEWKGWNGSGRGVEREGVREWKGRGRGGRVGERKGGGRGVEGER